MTKLGNVEVSFDCEETVFCCVSYQQKFSFIKIVARVMESVGVAEVMIKGKAAGKYIAMSANGELYTTVSKNCMS